MQYLRVAWEIQSEAVGNILHMDMDAFYAAVEVLDNPSLRGKPVIVGSPPDKRGVVATASYEARQFGVHSAMPSRTAGKLCPHGVFLPPRMSRYVEISSRVMAIVGEFSPVVEQVSIDEAFVDVSGAHRAFGDSVRIATALKARIRADIGLTASVGVAPNKFLAKLGSDLHKPDGMTVVPDDPAGIESFLAPLPVTRIWGVGKVTAGILHACGIRTIGDVQRRDVIELRGRVGPVLASHIHELAFGRDNRPVVTEYDAKSISSECTFDEDCDDPDVLRQTLIGQAEVVGRRLRDGQVLGRVAQIKVRFDDFQTVTRQKTLPSPIANDRRLMSCALELFEQQRIARPVRLIGFGMSDLCHAVDAMGNQPLLFPEMAPGQDSEKDRRLDRAVDRIRDQFGSGSLRRGV